jgi:hypothetical protein
MVRCLVVWPQIAGRFLPNITVQEIHFCFILVSQVNLLSAPFFFPHSPPLPLGNDEVVIYPWTMVNDFIMWSTSTRIAMGGGGDGFGFALDDDFLTGQSNASEAFGNPPLTSYAGSFRVTNVEVWGFESVIGRR